MIVRRRVTLLTAAMLLMLTYLVIAVTYIAWVVR